MKFQSKVTLHPKLTGYVTALFTEMRSIPAERKEKLEQVAKFIIDKTQRGETANLTFICTHNSRRSHLSQLWAALAAAYHGVKPVQTFSGGSAATAFNPRAVAAIGRAGFQVVNPGGDNPHYLVSFSPDVPAGECYSKKYDDRANPKESFAAIMTCSQADRICPIVKGAALRMAIPYEDPQVADDTPKEAAKYDERCKQIATEMLYLFSKVQS